MVQTPAWQVSGFLQTPLELSPQADPSALFCVISVSVQKPGAVHSFPPIVQTVAELFEQRSVQTFSLHASGFGVAMHAPARRPQLHFDGAPAFTSVELWQLISFALWDQVSQW